MRFLPFATAVLLAGCTSAADTDLGPPPSDYRQIVREHVRATFFDPYSIRDAQIAPPKPGSLYVEGTFRHATGWLVCMRANAKNRMGAYTGIKETVMLISAGRVEASLSGPQWDHRNGIDCADVRYEPFRELEAQVAPRG